MVDYSYMGAFILFGIPLLFLIKILLEEVKDKIEKKKPENQQYYYIKNIQAEDIPSYEDDIAFCEEHKQSIEALMDEGMLNKTIASYVLRIIFFTDSWHKAFIERALASIQRALIIQYGGVGAVYRYNYILGIFRQTGKLTADEVKEYRHILQDIVLNNIK